MDTSQRLPFLITNEKNAIVLIVERICLIFGRCEDSKEYRF